MGINNSTFQNDILNGIKNEFVKYGKDIDTSIDFGTILLDYTNWRRRFIGPGYRKVFYSNELKNNPLYKFNKKFRKTIDKIAYKLKNAESLNPFLSKGIVDNPNEDGSNKNKDLMLNSFGIHHFHIGNEYEKNSKNGIRFTKRNDEILFAVIKKDAAYFINIYEHDFPYKQNAFEIIHDNWKFLLKDHEMQGVVSITECSEDDIKKLTKNHISTVLNIRGKSYIINSLATSGHSGTWFFEQKALIDTINHIDITIKLQERQILNQLNQALHQNLSSLNIGIVVKDGLLYFVEHQTEKTIVFRENEFIIANDYCLIGSHTFDLNS
jgi:hypothetical protein